jgi:diguanylate cyclase (GGDEF)-like protein
MPTVVRHPDMPDPPPANARLPVQTDEAKSSSLLNAVAKIAVEDIELGPMLQRIVDTLREGLGWEFAACVGIDREHDRFICLAVSTDLPTEIVVGYSRPLGYGVVGEVAQRETAIVLDDVTAHSNYVETLEGVKSEICVPVKHQGKLLAVLNAESTRPAAFHGQLPLMETIADQVAGAIACALAYSEAKRRAEELEVIRRLSQIAIDEDDLARLLTRLATAIREQLQTLIASVVVIDEKKHAIEYISRDDREDIELRTGSPVALEGIIGRAIATGETQYVEDVHSDPAYVAFEPRTNSELTVPIHFAGAILGAINIESDTPLFFNENTRRLIEMVATQIAGAIHRARVSDRLAIAYEELESKTRELEMANTELQLANLALDKLSRHDPLTGLANRRHFDEMLECEWKRSIRTGAPLTVLLIDVDHFKAYNDNYGHVAGDEALRKIALCLLDCLQRAGDVTARYGGEEFVALLPVTPSEGAAVIAEAVRSKVEMLAIEHRVPSAESVLTISIGVATRRISMARSSDLLVEADNALYAAKTSGRNRVVISSQ